MPTMLLATSLGVFALPVLVVVAAVVDLARFRRRLPTVRVVLFLVQYGLDDSAEILLAPFYWVAAASGRGSPADRLSDGISDCRHGRSHFLRDAPSNSSGSESKSTKTATMRWPATPPSCCAAT